MSTDTAVPNPLRDGLVEQRVPEPCALVIFGASGDLTKRKLLPALYSLYRDHLLPHAFSVVGFARRPIPDFVDQMRAACERFARRRPVDGAVWDAFAQGISYVQGDMEDGGVAPYLALKEHLGEIDRARGTQGNRVFYLSTPPSFYPIVLQRLGEAGLIGDGARPFTRVIIEKPFGRDLESARALNRTAASVLREDQTFRIDHYLGKETVQNIFVLRFANALFEPLWNAKYIDHVQLTVAEAIGVEGRGSYFEEAGIVRDMVQNHMFQFLTLMAMEPPNAFDANAVRDEKTKILRALRPYSPEEVARDVVRGQYLAGSSMGEKKAGYLDEKGVKPGSVTETYVAMKLHIDNWRWSGVPFYLRAGKALPKRVTEIAIQFKSPPPLFFSKGDSPAPAASADSTEGPPRPVDKGIAGARSPREGGSSRAQLQPNVLSIRIQPDEGISLKFVSKVPGQSMEVLPVTMEFRYGSSFGAEPPEAYERLILDCMLGDSTLYTRGDESEASWRWIDRIFAAWKAAPAGPPRPYAFGSWGPAEADDLLVRDGARVEAAVSEPAPPAADASQRAADFAAGHAVAVALPQIEKELAAMWRATAEGAAAAQRAVTRACLWNVIVRTGPGEPFARVKRIIDAISPLVPARVLVLKTGEAPSSGAPIGAWIEANWHTVAGGATQVGSDEVTLEAAGAAVDDLAGVVRALVVPDVPSAALWYGTAPDRDLLDAELLGAADRLIVDGDTAESLRAFAERLAQAERRGPPATPVALSWLRGAPFRQLLAGLFDPPAPTSDLRSIDDVEIACTPGQAGGAMLFVGWLAARLQFRESRRLEPEGAIARWDMQRPGGRVLVRLDPLPAPARPFSKVTLRTRGGDYSLGRDGPWVVLNTPAIACRQPFTEPEETELWLAALSGRGHDPLFTEALARAALF